MSEIAVILLSGGLDSATTLAIARAESYDCYALSFDYGQRHLTELRYARAIAQAACVVEHRVVQLDLGGMGGSALTDHSLAVPTSEDVGIPITYVPARNTLFLAYGLGWAEVLGARHLFIGVNAVDYSGYPDCRPEFIAAFEAMANLATREGVEGRPISIETPLIDLSKSEIIRLGLDLGVDYATTVSCYSLNDRGEACGECDSCRIRRQGFEVAGISDPTCYRP